MTLLFHRDTEEYNAAFKKAQQLFEAGAEISYLDPAAGAIVIISLPWRITVQEKTIQVEDMTLKSRL